MGASRLAWAIAALAALGGCAPGRHPAAPDPFVNRGPEPDTPAHAVERVRWAWANRDTMALRDVLTGDFEFHYPGVDSSGTDTLFAWGRVVELQASGRVFLGGEGPDEPAASEVMILFDPNLPDSPDPRPGRDPRVHRRIETTVVLMVRFPSTTWEVRGVAAFALTRGDSAAIPPALAARGIEPDSTRWWVDGWWDSALPVGTRGAFPASSRGWAAIKRLYL